VIKLTFEDDVKELDNILKNKTREEIKVVSFMSRVNGFLEELEEVSEELEGI
jgi:hypothetical protein